MEFKILEIKELLFESQESIEYTSGKDCKFGFDIDFSFDKQKEKNLYQIWMHIAIAQNKSKEVKGQVLVHTDYIMTVEVKELSKILKDVKRFRLLKLNLISVLYSTVRGCVLVKTREYSFHDEIFLPVISPIEMLSNWEKKKIQIPKQKNRISKTRNKTKKRKAK